MGIALKTVEPTIEPVSLAEAKLHLRVDHTDEDVMIAGLVTAAREWCESFTGRQFCLATWQLKRDVFAATVELPHPPLSSFTSITYTDTAGASQTLASTVYTVNSSGIFPRVYLAYGQTWPAVRDIPDAVTYNYIAGYGSTAASVPHSIKQAVKVMIEKLYLRDPDMAVAEKLMRAASDLLWPYRAVLKI